MKKILLFLCILIVSVDCAAAQQLSRPGMAQRPYRLFGNIDLVKEDVRLMLTPTACLVEAVYVMANHSRYSDQLYSGLPGADEGQYQDVHVELDGAELLLQSRKEQEQIIGDSGEYEFSRLVPIYWTLWNADFAPGQVRTLTLRYSIPIAGQIDVTSVYRERIEAELTSSPAGLSEEANTFLGDIAVRGTGYAVSPQSKWNTPPEGMTISVLNQPGISSDESAKYAMEAPCVWRENGPAPGKELRVEYDPSPANVEQAALIQRLLEQHPNSKSIAKLAENDNRVFNVSTEPIAMPGKKKRHEAY